MSSCWTRRHVSLSDKKRGLPVEHEDMSSCWSRRQCLLVERGDVSSCWTRTHVLFSYKKTCLVVQQEDMARPPAQQEGMCSCWARLNRVSSCSARDMPSCPTRRNVFLLNTRTCLPVRQEDTSSCQESTNSLHCANRHESLLIATSCHYFAANSAPFTAIRCCSRLVHR